MELGKSVVYQEANRGANFHSFHSDKLPQCLSDKFHCFTGVLYFLTEWFLFVTETRVDVKESVRGQTIFIIQTIPR